MKNLAHTNNSVPKESLINDPTENLVVIACGGHAIRVIAKTNGLGVSSPADRFSNVIYIDSDCSYLENIEGRPFLEQGGEVIRLSHSEVRGYVQAAIEGRSSAPYVEEIKSIWTGTPEMLSSSLTAVENGLGGCQLRSVTALSIYSNANSILGKIASKISVIKKLKVDPRAATRILIIGSLDGSVGSGCATTLTYLLLNKIPNISITVSGVLHNRNEIVGYTGNESQANLLRANSFMALIELERLKSASFSLSKSSSSISFVEILDGDNLSLTNEELESAHAKALSIQYVFGVNSAHQRRTINELYHVRTGAIRLIGRGIVYGVPPELRDYTAITAELQFVETLFKEGDSSPRLEGILQKFAPIQMPPDLAESLLATTSVAGSVALAGKLIDDLNNTERGIAESLSQIGKEEKIRVASQVSSLLANALPWCGVNAAKNSLESAMQANDKIIVGLKSKVGTLRLCATSIDEGVGTSSDENNLLLHRIRSMPRSILIGLSVSAVAGLALLSAADFFLQCIGTLMIFAASLTLVLTLKKRDPQKNSFESLIRQVQARRELIASNAELTLHASRAEGLSLVCEKIKLLKQRLVDQRDKLLRRRDEIIVEENSATYSAISCAQFPELVNSFPSANIGNIDFLDEAWILPYLAISATTYAQQQFDDFSLSKIGSQSPEARERLSSVLSSAAKVNDFHKADPSKIPRQEIWATSGEEIFEGPEAVRTAIDNSASAKSVFVLCWLRGLKAAELGIYDDLQAAAKDMADVPTRTLPPVLVKDKYTNSLVKPSNYRVAASVNGYAIATDITS